MKAKIYNYTKKFKKIKVENIGSKSRLDNIVKKNLDDDIPFYDYDAHSCSAEADDYGVCQYCGRVVHGTMAYLDIYGGE